MSTNGDQHPDSNPDTNPDTLTPLPDLTIAQAAEMTGLHKNTVRKRVRAGQIPGAYLHPGTNGQEWRIPRASVEALRQATPAHDWAGEALRQALTPLLVTEQLETARAELETARAELETARAELARTQADAELQATLAHERAQTINLLTNALMRIPVIENTGKSANYRGESANNPQPRRWWQRRRK